MHGRLNLLQEVTAKEAEHTLDSSCVPYVLWFKGFGLFMGASLVTPAGMHHTLG
jgi:hypothetical protein